MVKVVWVKGHAGNKGNEEADAAADQGHFGAVWDLNQSQHNDMHCHATFNNAPAEDDLRQTLKLQTAARTHQVWLAQNRTQEHIKDWTAIDWSATMAIVHDRNPPKALYTSVADCQKRAHRMKKLHGMLPTQSYMKHWQPDLYTTDTCRVCEQEREDTAHLWQCPATRDTQHEIWTEAISNVNDIGMRKWRKDIKKWREEEAKAREKGRDTSRRNAPKFSSMEEDYIWNSLALEVSGVKEIQRNGGEDPEVEEDEEMEEIPVWSVQDIYHGLTPKSIGKTWKSVFETTQSIASYMAGRFVSAIEEAGRTEIWNKRCKVTVDWEKAHGISAMSKRAGRRNCAEGHRRSSIDFMGPTLRPRRALNVKESHRVADDRVRDSYLGRVQLDVMERLGGMKFLMTMDCG
jgi:hypothetical protein